MPKKEFECICKKFKVRGRSKILENSEECPICGEKITDQVEIEKIEVKTEPEPQIHNTEPPILTAQGHLRENSPTYFGTSKNRRSILGIFDEEGG